MDRGETWFGFGSGFSGFAGRHWLRLGGGLVVGDLKRDFFGHTIAPPPFKPLILSVRSIKSK